MFLFLNIIACSKQQCKTILKVVKDCDANVAFSVSHLWLLAIFLQVTVDTNPEILTRKTSPVEFFE